MVFVAVPKNKSTSRRMHVFSENQLSDDRLFHMVEVNRSTDDMEQCQKSLERVTTVRAHECHY